ncbi:MAG: alpha/beta hydrolase fold domain-containing protein [Candidatus Latescibacteria bacterium]|nr:alpha/beta hydrolase fold domain-containing protein [Candidatus Latescibacterota bacterium]
MKRMAPRKEPLTLELWPGPVPRDIGIEGQETTRLYNSDLVGDTLLVTNVTRPSISVYLPPQENNTGTAVVVCPGGGYWDLFWQLEGEEVVAWLNQQGIAGIILKYRVPRRPGEEKRAPPVGPQLDAQRALSLVRSQATEWDLDPNRIGIMGFSVGGHLALATATQFKTRTYEPIDPIDTVSCRPDFAVLCYSGYLKKFESDEIWPDFDIAADTSPVFLAHASDDSIAPVEHSIIMYLALHRAGISAELHAYTSGEHDFGVRQNDQLPSTWTGLCLRWLGSLGLLR